MNIVISWINESIKGVDRYMIENLKPALTRATKAIYFIGNLDFLLVCIFAWFYIHRKLNFGISAFHPFFVFFLFYNLLFNRTNPKGKKFYNMHGESKHIIHWIMSKKLTQEFSQFNLYKDKNWFNLVFRSLWYDFKKQKMCRVCRMQK